MTNTTLDAGDIRLSKDTTTPALWTRVWDGVGPQKYDYGFDYDPVNGVYVMFGGTGSPVIVNETWLYNPVTNKWNNTGAVGPVQRVGSPLAYDPVYGVFVMYSGTNNVNETWTYNATTNAWTLITTTNSPEARYYHCMAYDSVNKVIVLFGGYSSFYGLNMNDTWTFSLSNNTWTNMNPADAPPQYTRSPMAFDQANGVMVAFVLGQTWTYNVSNNTWTNMNPASPPGSRQLPGFHYSPIDKVIVMFGGITSWSDTWTYNVSNNTWTNMAPSFAPSQRTTMMDFNPFTGEMIIYSGLHSSPTPAGYLQELWAYNYSQNTWRQVLNSGPQYRAYGQIAYHPDSNCMVSFGGYTTSPINVYYNDTWIFNMTTKTWTNVTTVNRPLPRAFAGFTYDSETRLLVLFGGYSVVWTGSTSAIRYLNDTWTYNITTNTWTNMTSGTEPDPRRVDGMDYDQGNHLFMMFGGVNSGGSYINDTWTYSSGNNTWTNMYTITAPTPRYSGSMVYDPDVNGFILFGGLASGSNNNETWRYTYANNTWTNMYPAGAVPMRYANAFAYDPSDRLLIVFSGIVGTGLANVTWTYSSANNTWFMPATTTPPPTATQRTGPRGGCSNDGLFFTFGGSGQADAWTLRLSVKYYGDGSYTSNAFDSGGQSYFGTVEWNSTVVPSTTLKLQFRTANTSVALSSATFLGPDGTSNTNYTSFPVALNSVHNNSRWFQYIAYFNTTNSSNTSRLKDVTVKYNRGQTVTMTAPVGGEKWNDTKAINWTGSDPDGDTITYDINAVNTTTGVRLNLASNLPMATTTWSWNTNITPNGTYWIEVVANDTNPVVPVRGINSTSGAITVFHSKQPSVTLSSPGNSATVYRSWANLSWAGSDPESDPLSYYVYFSSGPINPANPGTPTAYTVNSYYNVTGLVNGTYNWTVKPNDGYQDGPIATPWTFTTSLNDQPIVNLLSPPSGTTRYRNWANLTWNGYDGDANPITYSIFLSTGPIDIYNPGTPVSTTSNTWYNATGIVNGSYNWTVRGNDGKENGPAPVPWRFNMSINTPPTANLVSPADGGTVLRANVTMSWGHSDGEGDALNYYVLLQTTPINLANLPTPVANVTTSSFTAINLANGTYYWTIVPSDGKENGTAPTPQSFVVAMNRPPTATLKSPTNNSFAYRDWAYLNWTGSDGDANPLTYYILVSSSPINLANPPVPVATVTVPGYNATGLVNGTYYWTVIPDDGKENGTTPEPWKYNVSVNGPPTITLLTPSNNGNIYNTSTTLTWDASDLDNDPIKYYVIVSLSSINLAKPPAPEATIDTTSYELKGLLNGTYYWTVIPNDGKENSTSLMVWKFTVKINRPPTVQLLSPDDKSTVSGTHVGLKWLGVDPEGDSLSYYIFFLNATFDAGSLPATVASTKDQMYTANDLEDGSTYYWAIIANDGKANGSLSVVRMFMVGTPTTNHPATVTLTIPASGSTVDVLNPSMGWTFYDDEGDSVTFDIYLSETRTAVDSFMDSAKVATNLKGNGFTMSLPLTKGRTYYWTVVPFDGHSKGICTSGTWYFKVSDYATLNNPPEFTSKPPTGDIEIGTEWSYTPTTKDLDVGDKVDLKLLSGPDGMALEDGTLKWTPAEDQVGANEVIIQASDGRGNTLQVFTITVKPGKPNNPPMIKAIDDRTMEVGDDLSVSIAATDPDLDKLTFTIVQGPKSAKVDDKGLITWKPSEADIGTVGISFTVSDGKDTVSSSFNVTVLAKKKTDNAGAMAGFPWWLILMLVLMVVAAVLAVRLRKKGMEVEGPQTAPEPTQAAVPVPQPTQQPVTQASVTPGKTGLRPVLVKRTVAAPVQPVYAHATPVQPMSTLPLPPPPPPLTSHSTQMDIILQEEATDVITDAMEAIDDAQSIGKDVTRAEATLKVATTYYEKGIYKKAIEYGRLVYHVIE